VIDHTIVAGNSDTRRGAADLSIALAAGFDALYSLIGNNQGSGLAAAVSAPDEDGNLIGTSGAAINPQLGPLGDNQGPTLTHALLKGSPAIDAGRPNAVPGQLGVPGNDQRGDEFARVVNGRLDIGAVEFKEVEPDGGGDGDGGGGNGGGGDGGGDGGGGGGDGGGDGGSEQDVFLFDGGSAAVEIQNPPVDADSENTVEVEVSLLNVIDPPAAQLFPNSDGGAGGGFPNGNQPQQVTDPEPVLDERVMQAVYYRAPVVHNEELVDAVFSLGEIEQVSLLGVDMGDEPVFRQPLKAAAKKTADAVAEALGEPAPPIAQVPALEVPTAAGWRSLVLWAALAGSCTLWISGTWWWMHRGRKHPS
jgi:hypothetical protein